MTELRKRFLEDMQLRGLAPSTQTVYVHVIRQIAKHYHQSPDLLSEDQIRQYFLHLTQVRHVSRSLATTTLCALKFFFERTLQRRWPLFAVARPRKVKSLPTVLSRDEVRRLLACVEGPTFHMYFTTVYACGLRREEARLLRVQDIDGARGLVHVRGKGAKERWAPLPAPLLIQLREFWKTHRTRPWLFPHPGSLDRPRPLSRRALHLAFAAARERCGLDILNCRTEFFGGHVAQCDHCGHLRYAYHSCRNRHCPKCHGEQADDWLERQRSLLLPAPHFLLTFTLPAELRSLAFGHQKDVYGALLRCAAQSVLKLTADPRWLGATPTVLAVFHTWTRAMLFHPHVHLLVSAGGLTADGQRWLPARNPAFLAPVRALSVIFRAKMRDALKADALLDQAPARVWRKPWVVHSQHAGSGTKVLEYLARYVFRVAITNSRIEAFDRGQVTFRYRDNRTQQLRHVCVPAEEFIHRFLHHVLPRGFPKVRHYGLASTARAQDRQRALRLQTRDHGPSAPGPSSNPSTGALPAVESLPVCPRCHHGHLQVIQTLRPRRKFPP